MNKKIIDLIPGDIVQYTGLDGVYREIEYVGQNGFVRCIKGRDYTPNLVFKFNDKIMHAPLEAWLFTKIPYIVRNKQHG